MPKAVAAPLYQVKVTLTGVRPPVWRRLLVPSSISLKKFHQILQIALGWTDSHLHEFKARGQTYGIPHSEYPNSTQDEARVRLNEVLIKEKDWMLYEYDFGDGWEHKVVVEKVLSLKPDVTAPKCIAGARACPPEDCGGVGGYEEFLEAIKDPFHPEHEEMLEWIGGDFDPNYFDPEEVNGELRARIRRL
jgi:hypothetical protein